MGLWNFSWQVRFAFLFALFPLAVSAVAQVGPTFVVPNHLADTEGNFDNMIPWDNEAPVRYQQVFSGSQLGDIEIKQIRYRVDVNFGDAFNDRLTGVVVVLSSTDKAPDGLSMVFSENLSGDAEVVYSGDPTLFAVSDTLTPHRLGTVLTFDQAFVFDVDAGLNLLLDVTIADGPDLSSFDAEFTDADSVSRVYCWVFEECLTTDDAMIADTVGLVTRFLDELVFADGFESGDSSSWTATIWSAIEP